MKEKHVVDEKKKVELSEEVQTGDWEGMKSRSPEMPFQEVTIT